MNNDIKIVIDPGHGGSDPGAVGKIIEKDYSLKISEYLNDRFKELGVSSVLVRTTDETLTPNERVNRILSLYGNRPDVLVISNHLNAGGGEGAEVIYALRSNDTLPKLILDNLKEEGQIVRKAYQRRLPSDNNKDYYFIHRNTGLTEPIIIEYGFVDNINDSNKIKENYKDYAEAVVRAVAMYKNIPYEKPYKSDSYIVEKGDTLWSISKKFNTTVEELKKTNNLEGNMLYIGQKLLVPGYIKAEDTNITYIVKQGDTLYSIATQYGVSINDLKKYNNLEKDILSIGQEVLIPSSNTIIIPSEDDIINEPNTYIVEKGDTLYLISRKFNIPVMDIMIQNNLTSELLKEGQILQIPISDTNIDDIIIYKVKMGDTLYSLSKEYNTTIEDIKQLNNLNSDILKINQELQIKKNTNI